MNIYEARQENGAIVRSYQKNKRNTPLNDCLANIVARVPDYMYLKDSITGTYLGGSNAILQLLGVLDPQEIIGKTNREVIDPIKHKAILPFIQLLEHYEELLCINKMQYKNILPEPFINSKGRIVQLEMSFTPISSDRKDVNIIQIYAQDISDQKSAAELLQMYEKLYADQKIATFMFLEHIGFSKYIIPNASITKRELDILILFSSGKTAKEIARAVNISPRTAEKHLDKIKEKINVRNRIQLMRIFMSCFRC